MCHTTQSQTTSIPTRQGAVADVGNHKPVHLPGSRHRGKFVEAPLPDVLRQVHLLHQVVGILEVGTGDGVLLASTLQGDLGGALLPLDPHGALLLRAQRGTGDDHV